MKVIAIALITFAVLRVLSRTQWFRSMNAKKKTGVLVVGLNDDDLTR